MSKEDANIDDISEEDVGEIMDVISTDGYYKQAEIVQGHRAYHEFENAQDTIVKQMGGI